MRVNKNKFGFILLCLFLASISLSQNDSALSKFREKRWEKHISKDIIYTFIKRDTRYGIVNVHKLAINTNSPSVRVRPAIAKNKIGATERVDSIAKRENAVVAINGSFFEAKRKPNLPVGILIADGRVINKSLLNRTALGITSTGNVIFGTPKMKGEVLNPITKEKFSVWGVNRPRKKHEVILYTPEYGKSSRTNKWGKEIIVSRGKVVAHGVGGSEIPTDGCVISFHGWTRKYIDLFPVGSYVVINFGLNGSWEMVDHVITGGPLLMKAGKVMVKRSVIEEIFRGLILKPTARTAAGIDDYGKLYFFVVDKRPGASAGTTFSELAKIMRDEGIMNGMALDGGGSSTLVIDGEIKNYPMYGYPIPVSNALIVQQDGYKFFAKKFPTKSKSVPPKPPRKETELVPSEVEGVEADEPMPEWIDIFEATGESEFEEVITEIYRKMFLPFFPTWEAE
jgi:exopolysaccharide biosynthesis protein